MTLTTPATLAYTGGEKLNTDTIDEMLYNEQKLLFNPEFRHSIMIWGPTGIGKSAIQRQLLAKHAKTNAEKQWEPAQAGAKPPDILEVFGQWGLVDKRLHTAEPTDIQGFPSLNGETSRWVPPPELPLVGQEKNFPENGILLLDELNLASPPLQAVGYALARDHRAGTHKLLPGWKVVAAGNLRSEMAYTYDLGHPLRNRFMNYVLRCDLDAFKRWGYEHEIDERVIAFLSWNETYLHSDSDATAYAFPTPRSWEYVSDVMKSFSNGTIFTNIRACVGPGVAAIFNGILEVYEQETQGEANSP